MNDAGLRIQGLCRRMAAGERIDWAAETAAIMPEEERSRLDSLHELDRIWQALPPGDREADVPTGRSWSGLLVGRLIARERDATLHEAWDPGLERPIALFRVPIVTLDPGEVTRLLETTGRLITLRHPNVVTVHGAAAADGDLGYWMELQEGRTLQSRLEEYGPLGADEAVLIGHSVCRGIAALHGVGVVHGSLTPATILRQRGGRIIILGIRPGGGDDPSVDIRAIGALLESLVIGTKDPTTATLPGGAAGRPSDPGPGPGAPRRDQIPPAYLAVVARAMSADPAVRYASPGAIEADLTLS